MLRHCIDFIHVSWNNIGKINQRAGMDVIYLNSNQRLNFIGASIETLEK